MKTKLIKIPLIIIICILVIGILYWYLNYQVTKSTPNAGETVKETIKPRIETATGTEKTVGKNIKSIELEKPPFIKD